MRSPHSAVAIVLVLSVCAGLAWGTGQTPLQHLRTIVIDPGHGGSNEGAVGVAGIYERFLTMETAMLLRERLGERFPAVRVILTREEDIDVGLEERLHTANAAEADLFISLHYNAATNTAAHGLEVYYLSADEPQPAPWPENARLVAASGTVVESILLDLERTRLHGESARLAETLHAELIRGTGSADRGVRQAQFRVLRGAHMPAVVVELGFLTHAEEGLRLVEREYTEAVVEALIAGVVAFDREGQATE